MGIRGIVRIAVILIVGAFGIHAAALMDPGSWYGGMTPLAVAAEPSRDAYVKENEGRFEEWGRKIDRFNEEAQRKSHAARQKLDAAWVDTRRNWNALKATSQEGWNEAKRSFEESWSKLERAWDEARR